MRFTMLLGLLAILVGTPAFAGQDMTVAEGRGAMSSAYHVALEKGFFAEESANIKTQTYDKGLAAFEAYLDGKNDIATTNRVSLSLKELNSDEHAIIGVIAYNENAVKVLARRDHGINVSTDLAGKTIGVIYGTTHHFWIYKWLAYNGMGADDVELQFFKKKQLPKALVNGKVDAIVGNVGVIEVAQSDLGEDGVLFTVPRLDMKVVPLVVRRSLIKNHRAEILAHMRALIAAEEYIKEHPAECAEIVSRRKKLDYDTMLEFINSEAQFYLSLPQSLLTDLEMVDRWAIEYNLVSYKKPRNYLKLIDSSLLQEIDPGRVTIIQ